MGNLKWLTQSADKVFVHAVFIQAPRNYIKSLKYRAIVHTEVYAINCIKWQQKIEFIFMI